MKRKDKGKQCEGLLMYVSRKSAAHISHVHCGKDQHYIRRPHSCHSFANGATAPAWTKTTQLSHVVFVGFVKCL